MNTTTSLTVDPAAASTRAFLERWLPPPRPFDVRWWEGTVLQAALHPGHPFARRGAAHVSSAD